MLKIFLTILISFIIAVIVVLFPIISPAILIVLLVNIIIFLSPQYFILFWLIVAGFSSAIQLPGGMTSYGAMNIIFMPSLILKICVNYRNEIFKYPIIKFYLFFLTVYFISIWYSPIPHFMCFRKYWAFVIPLLLSILITGAFKNSKIIEKYLRITLSFVAFFGILSTIMFMLGKWKISGDIDRAEGFFGHPNLYAMYLNFHFGISLTMAMFLNKRKDQIFYYLISLILCLALIPTFSKGAYIMCLFIFFTLSLLAIPIKRQVIHVFIALGFILILCLFAIIFFHSTIAHRFSNENTLLWRIKLWKDLLKYVMQSPIWGHGYLSYFRITGDVLGISSGFAPHSQYLEVLLDVGFIGLIAFLGSYIGMLFYALKIFKNSTKNNFIRALSLGFVVSMIATLFHSFTEVSFYIPMLNLYLWFYFGFIVALNNIKPQI